jgi:hypothetical protein
MIPSSRSRGLEQRAPAGEAGQGWSRPLGSLFYFFDAFVKIVIYRRDAETLRNACEVFEDFLCALCGSAVKIDPVFRFIRFYPHSSAAK